MDDWTNNKAARLSIALGVLVAIAIAVAVAYALSGFAPSHWNGYSA
jgi:hypothetical protein